MCYVYKQERCDLNLIQSIKTALKCVSLLNYLNEFEGRDRGVERWWVGG
jgi:hypothetical protein